MKLNLSKCNLPTLVVLLIILAVSCKKEKNINTSAPSGHPKDVYQYQQINYIFNDQSSSSNDSTIVAQREYLNNASTDLSGTITIPDQKEISSFSISDSDSRLLSAIDSPKISVPVLIDQGKIHTGPSVWKYTVNSTEALPAGTTNQRVSVSVKANTRVTLNIYAHWRLLSTGYTATFKEQHSGKIVNVSGVWQGRQILGFSTVAVASDLK